MDNKNTSRAKLQKQSHQNDRISEMPEQLLLTILSLLPFKDAVIACMASPRWTNLWMNSICCWNLEIPGKERVGFYIDPRASRLTERVNRAIDLHSGPYLEELRIGAYVGTCQPNQVQRWINFAILNGVKVFALMIEPIGFDPMYIYSFPCVDNFAKLLDDKKSEEVLHHPCRVHRENHQFRSFCRLKSLSLGHLGVRDEIIHYFLSNYMFLEHLRVEFPKTLFNLEVANGLRLKCLEIVYCSNIKGLKIYTRNLESLVYSKIDMPFQNTRLNHLLQTIGLQFCESFAVEHDKHRLYLSQLEALKFQVPYRAHTFFYRKPCEFPEMINLRHLELQVTISKSLLGLMLFFIASTFLSTFRMDYHLRRSFKETEEQTLERLIRDIRHEARRVKHQHLQKLE